MLALAPAFAAAPPGRACGDVAAEWLALALVAAAVIYGAALLALPLGMLADWAPDPSRPGGAAQLKAPWPFAAAGGCSAHGRADDGRAIAENVIAAAPVRPASGAAQPPRPAAVLSTALLAEP